VQTTYNSTITTILVSLFVYWACFSIAQVQAETCYIIVHAHNPEGVEIASIEGMEPYCVEIYDGDILIGYGAYSKETHNKPIPISPGNHTIKAKFNGMTIEQDVSIAGGTTQGLTITFNRVEINDLLNGSSQESVHGLRLWKFG